jgi:hypothetical protein
MEQNTTSVVIEQQGENKKRGALAVILAVAFVAMLGIGSTFAYMQWTGNQTPNRFTVDKGLKADLVEPAWTKAAAASTGYPDVASDGTTKIPHLANNFSTVGTTVAKDPYVVNTSMVGNEQDQAGADAYVAIRLTFQKWVASSAGAGTGQNHTEEGKYVTMSDEEVQAFFKCYNLNTETQYKSDASEDDKAELKENGYWRPVLGDGWLLLGDGGTASVWTKGESGAATFNPSSQMTFVYKYGISSIGESIDGASYPDAATAAVAGSEAKKASKTTTNLFKEVELLDAGENLSNFIRLIGNSSNNATSDPGFRILVDTAAVECTDIKKEIQNDAAATTQLAGNDIWPEVRADGASPKSNTYVDGDGNAKGSGYAEGASNVPESYWGWNSTTSDVADESVD